MSLLFVANKPINISSNNYLTRLKRKYKIKKMGHSGTLDPFATGTLVIATDAWTKLLPYLKLTPKIYQATIWLGAKSLSGDMENITSIESHPPLEYEKLIQSIASMEGSITYTPPAFSAKTVGGKRAYALARAGEEVNLEPITSFIDSATLIHYNHPFVTLQFTVSKGSYIRSFAQILLEKMGAFGTLSSLRRVREGRYQYDLEKKLCIIDQLEINFNKTSLPDEHFVTGKLLQLGDFEIQEDGEYLILFEEFFSIIKIENKDVTYLLNRIEKC